MTGSRCSAARVNQLWVSADIRYYVNEVQPLTLKHLLRRVVHGRHTKLVRHLFGPLARAVVHGDALDPPQLPPRRELKA